MAGGLLLVTKRIFHEALGLHSCFWFWEDETVQLLAELAPHATTPSFEIISGCDNRARSDESGGTA